MNYIIGFQYSILIIMCIVVNKKTNFVNYALLS